MVPVSVNCTPLLCSQECELAKQTPCNTLFPGKVRKLCAVALLLILGLAIAHFTDEIGQLPLLNEHLCWKVANAHVRLQKAAVACFPLNGMEDCSWECLLYTAGGDKCGTGRWDYSCFVQFDHMQEVVLRRWY